MATAKRIKELKEKAILNATSFYHYKLICRSIGVDEDTMLIWRKKDKDFSDKIEIARAEFISKHMKAAKPEFLLERLEKDIFAERKELTGSEGRDFLPQPILGSKSVQSNNSDKKNILLKETN